MDNGKENGSYCSVVGSIKFYMDNGKENINYCSVAGFYNGLHG